MKRIFLGLWLLLCLNSSAQSPMVGAVFKASISGAVIDGGNGKAIDGAAVTIKGLTDTAYTRSAKTDRTGIFKFSDLQNGTYSIRISHVGYQSYTDGQLVIDDEHSSVMLNNVKLTAADHHLNEVVINAGQKAYTEQKIDRTIVNVGQLLSNTGVSAAEVLNNAPGVEVDDDAISLMGKQGVTIYIDGRQTFLGGTELVNYLRSLPSGSIEKLELMPIPPAKYHVSGSAGIINIITKKNRANGFNGSLIASYAQGQYAKTNYSLDLNYKTGKVNFFGGVSYNSNNNYFKVERQRKFNFADPAINYNIDQDNFETSDRRSTHYKFGFDAELDKNNSIGSTVDGSVSPYHENGEYLLQFVHSSPDSVIKTQSILDRQTNNVAANVYYLHKFKQDGENIRIDADYFNYYDNALQTLNSNTYLPNSTSLLSNYDLITQNPFRANVYSLKSDYEAMVLSAIKLSAGMQSIYSNRGSNGLYFNSPGVAYNALTSSNTYSEHINAAYISLDKSLKRLTVEVGLRFENSSSYAAQFNYAGVPNLPVHLTYNDLFPKLYASYKLDESGSDMLNFSFNSQVDRPDYSSLNPFAFYFDRYTVIQGNAVLQPARTTNFDLSYTHSGIFTIGASLSEGKNAIIQYYYVSGQSLVSTSFNINNTHNAQLYANTTIPIFKWCTANLFNSLTNKAFDGVVANGQLLNNSVFTYQVSGNDQFKFNNGWSAELSGSYRTNTTFGQGIYLPIWRLNASLQKKVLNGKGTITLSGADIFHSWKIRRDIVVNNAELIIANTNDTQQAKLTFGYRFGSAEKAKNNKSGLQTERSRGGR